MTITYIIVSVLCFVLIFALCSVFISSTCKERKEKATRKRTISSPMALNHHPYSKKHSGRNEQSVNV